MCLCGQCRPVLGGAGMVPVWMPAKGWQRHKKGYLMFSSRSTTAGIKRGEYAHREVVRRLGGVLGVGIVVHHQDGRRMNCCPLNLVLMPEEMNKVEQRRCPYTGKWLGKGEWAAMYGGDTGEPEWVRSSDW